MLNLFFKIIIIITFLDDKMLSCVIAGKIQLPSTARMYDYIESRWEEVKENYISTKRHDNLEVS